MKELTTQQTRRALRMSTFEGNFAGIHAALTGGMFLIGFVTAMGGSYVHFGLIAALPTLGTLVQIPAAYWFQKAPSRKPLTVISSFVSRFVWIVTPFLPFLFPLSTALWIFLGVFAFHCGILNVAANGWTSWMSDIVPRKMRGRYFSRRNMIISIVSLFVGTAAAYFVDFLKEGRPFGRTIAGILSPIIGFMKDWAAGSTDTVLKTKVELAGIGLLFFVASIAAVVSAYLLTRQPEPKREFGKDVRHASFFGSAREVFANKPFFSFLVFMTVWNFLNGFSAPLWVPYLYNQLKMSYAMVAWLGVLAGVIRIFVLPIWGRLVDRFGNRPVLRLSILVIGFHPLMWPIASPSFLLPIYIDTISSAIMWPAVEVAAFNLLLGSTPKERKEMFYAVYAATTGVAFSVTPLITGKVMDLAKFYGYELQAIVVFFCGVAAARFAAQLLLMRVKEEGARSVLYMVKTVWHDLRGLFLPSRPTLAVEETGSLPKPPHGKTKWY
ncbi:MAG: MFS transporter [Planctomycetota bacterium]|nr:MFS transporter [Planctomycetota bacterium]